MENDLINTVIETVVISPTDYGVKFEAQDKKIYNVPKTLKTGGFTKAWEQLVTMNFKPRDPITGESGTVVAIGYVETPNKHGGTSRYIRNFRETNELPTSQPETPRTDKKPDSVANFAPQGKTQGGQGEEFWDKKAYKQCLWNYWLQTPRQDLTPDWEDKVWEIFNHIEKDADERFSKPRSWAELGQKLKAQNPTPDVSNTQQAGIAKLTNEEPQVSADIQELADEMESEQVEQITGEDIPF